MKQTVVKMNGSPVTQPEPQAKRRALRPKEPQARTPTDVFEQYRPFLEPAFRAVGRCLFLVPLAAATIATAIWKGILAGAEYLAEAMKEAERKV